MPIPSYLAILLEAGAVTKPDQNSDARMIRYETGIYPENCGIELLVQDIEDFRLTAKMEEPRLAPFLEELTINMDLALATKAGEGGKMIRTLERELQAVLPKANQKKNTDDGNLNEMNYSTDKKTGPGNNTMYD